MESVMAKEEQPLTAKRVISIPFKVIGKILRIIFWAVLIVAIITAGLTAVWLMGKVETGAGEMTRFKAGRVYLKLAWEKEPRDCQGLFVSGTLVGILSAPMFAIDEAFDFQWLDAGGMPKEDTEWWQIPSRTLEALKVHMYTILHVGPTGWDHPYRCRLPLPEDWTPDLIE
jgi:hypothetical protein